MEQLWNKNWISMGDILKNYGINIQNEHGSFVEQLWTFYGTLIKLIWKYYGIIMKQLWNHKKLMYLYHRFLEPFILTEQNGTLNWNLSFHETKKKALAKYVKNKYFNYELTVVKARNLKEWYWNNQIRKEILFRMGRCVNG